MVLISMIFGVMAYRAIGIPILEQMPLMVGRCTDLQAVRLLQDEPGQVVIDTDRVRCQ
jgi:hypothetical protein